MISIEGKQLINRLQKQVVESGIKAEDLIPGFKELRTFALAEQDPTLTKVIRLTYEHLESNGTFNIPIPDDEEVEGYESTDELKPELDDEGRVESMKYLLDLMYDAQNKVNREDLKEYRDLLKEA